MTTGDTHTIRRTIIMGIYEVPSKSHPGYWHTTDVRDPLAPTCDCMAGQGGFKNCRHVRYCWHVLAAQDAYRADLEAEHMTNAAAIARLDALTERIAQDSVA